MLNEKLMNGVLGDVIFWMLVTIVTGVVGYLIWRTKQNAKNTATDEKFKIVGKDITNNDRRINARVTELSKRNDKMFADIGEDVKEISKLQVVDRQKILVTETALNGLQKSMDAVVDKLDTLVKIMIQSNKENNS